MFWLYCLEIGKLSDFLKFVMRAPFRLRVLYHIITNKHPTERRIVLAPPIKSGVSEQLKACTFLLKHRKNFALLKVNLI